MNMEFGPKKEIKKTTDQKPKSGVSLEKIKTLGLTALMTVFFNHGVTQAAPKQNETAKKDTLYVSDLNDPRLKAYQDSSALYNNYQTVTNALKKQEYSQYVPKESAFVDFIADQMGEEKTSFDKFAKNVSKRLARKGLELKDVSQDMHSTPDFVPEIINKTLPDQLYHDKIKPAGMKWYSFQGEPNSMEDPRVEENKKWHSFMTPFSRDHRVIANYENVKPTIEVVYKPEAEKVKADIVARSETERVKETVTPLETQKPDALTSNSEKHENKISRIPFKKGTYFTHLRDRQTQELGSKQFGREGLVDFFDKQTGKLLGTYPESYLDEKQGE